MDADDESADDRRDDDSISIVDSGSTASATTTATRNGRRRPKTSWVWAHTAEYNPEKDEPKNKGKRVCSHCKEWYAASCNTSTWAVHLSKKHKIDPPTAATCSSSQAHPVKKQTTMDSLGLVAPSTNEQNYLTNAVTDWIIDSMSSHRAVESDALKAMLAKFRPGYELPSRKTIGRRVLEQYAISLPVVCDLFEKLDVRFNLILDGWPNRNSIVSKCMIINPRTCMLISNVVPFITSLKIPTASPPAVVLAHQRSMDRHKDSHCQEHRAAHYRANRRRRSRQANCARNFRVSPVPRPRCDAKSPQSHHRQWQ